MPLDPSRLIRALLEPDASGLAHRLLVISEESMIAVDALKMTLYDLQEVHAELQARVDAINAHPSNYEEKPS
jgi:hypothetical protein